MSAWVPMTICASPPAIVPSTSFRSRPFTAEVRRQTRYGQRFSSLLNVRKCCSARISVGAMNAAWWPFSTTTAIDSSATSVLPEPTSPWTRRFIGWGERRSSAISRTTRRCAPVSGNGRIRFTASRAASPTSNAARLRAARTPLRRRARPSWKRNSSSRMSRRWPCERKRFSSSSESRSSGRCTRRMASPRPMTSSRSRSASGKGSARSAGTCAASCASTRRSGLTVSGPSFS